MLILEARVRGQVVHWPLRPARLIIGRARVSDIVIEDDSLSRRHLALTPTDSGARIEDLGSRNGVVFKGARCDMFDIGLDEPFAAGAVLLTVREGISLSQSASFEKQHEATSPTSQEPACNASSTRAGSSNLRAHLGLVDLLEGVQGAEGGVAALLRYLGEELGLRHVSLLRRSGNGWIVESNWGPLPDAQLLMAPTGLWLDGVVGDAAFLLVSPWDAATAQRETTRLAVGLIRMLLPAHRENGQPVGEIAAERKPSLATPAFVTVSPKCRALLEELDRLARSDLPLLVLGESGTGKEILARQIHARSSRHSGPFVAVNCAALPHELLEAELFGIEKGVATGVSPRPGRFLQASAGTLFLDEIGDLPSALQPKLLRALESNEVTPLGSPTPVPIDVRLVSATHRHEASLAESGTIRRDLLFRIAGASIVIPPLRERPEDVLPLARFFAKHAARSQGRGFRGIDLEAARTLTGYAWPGNVRELRHVIARAIALAEGSVLHAGLLPQALTGAADAVVGDVFVGLREEWRDARARFDRLYFARLLDRCGGNLSEAARVAGLSRSNLYAKLEELGLR